jgi:hypothetical protein
MKMGTRSLLFGAHLWWLHPIFVAIAWVKLFGWPTDIRIWFAFLLHDIGYWGCPEMDGPVGKRHPELGARVMGWLFGPVWASFTIRHSRSYADMEGLPVSALCAADKMAMVVEPKWLYLLRVRLTGEVEEYIKVNADLGLCKPGDLDGWYTQVSAYCERSAHKLADEIKYGTGDLMVAFND